MPGQATAKRSAFYYLILCSLTHAPNLTSSLATQSNKRNRPVRRSPAGTKSPPPRPSSPSPRSNIHVESGATRELVPRPHPLLTDYDLNRNPGVNRERLEQPILCPHFGQCSGCVVSSQVGTVDIIQSAKLYFSSTSVRRRRRDVIDQRLDWSVEGPDDGFYHVVVPSAVDGWRTQAKLAVAPKTSSWAKDGCTFGLYQRGTHTVLEIPNCAVHHPSINAAVEALVAAMKKVGTPAFVENARDGGLRYVQLQVERTTGKVSLTLVWNADSLKEAQPALSRLVKELARTKPDLWHGMWCHCNNGVGNNIFSRNPKRWYRLSGPEYVREPLPTSSYGWMYFTPLTFRQANSNGFDVLASDVARAVPGGSRVCELYAGVGVLGLSALAHHSSGDRPLRWLRCSDENPANPACFQRAVDSLPPDVTGRDSPPSRRSGHDDGVTLAELAAMMKTGKAASKLQPQQPMGEKTSYMVASASQAIRLGQALGAQVLIVDPPRKGLEEQVLAELSKPVNRDQPYVESAAVLPMDDGKVNWCNDVTTLMYVSCGFEALARDLDQLLSGPGGWVLESATGYVLFPGSDHVETVAILTRD